MWLTVLVMALAVSIEPFRLGMTALLLTRPRPVGDLLAFLCGGFLMGMAVGGAVLFGLHNTLGSGRFTLPKVQIGLGLLALLLAAVLASGVRLPRRGTTVPGGGTNSDLADRIRRMAADRSGWSIGVAGVAVALPSTDFLAVLAVILASGATPLTQLLALMLFNVIALFLVESALVAHLLAPEWTRTRVTALNTWAAANRRRALTVTLAAIGSVLLAVGLATV